jgi:hypothetical protein
MDVKEIALLAAIAASAGLYLTMVLGFVATMSSRATLPTLEATPRVSIMKPLAGIDDELADNLASLSDLDYPNYEVLIGVASTDDPAYAVARKFVARVGTDRARLFLTNPDDAINPKVAQLLTLEREATGDILLVSDSNVLATRDYLRPLVAELLRPGVAIVSSVIAGTGEQTLGAALENLQLGAVIAPGVVSAAKIARRPITVGKSMAMWRGPLERLGGLARVGNLLSEDHMLGRAFDKEGFGVGISLVPVANRNVDHRKTHALGQIAPSDRAGGLLVRAPTFADHHGHRGVAGDAEQDLLRGVPRRRDDANGMRFGLAAPFAGPRVALVLGAPRARTRLHSLHLLDARLHQPSGELARSSFRTRARLGHRPGGAGNLGSGAHAGSSLTNSPYR